MLGYLPEPDHSNNFHDKNGRLLNEGGYDSAGAPARVKDAGLQIAKGGGMIALGVPRGWLGAGLVASGIVNVGVGSARLGVEGITAVADVDVSEGTDALGKIDGLMLEEIARMVLGDDRYDEYVGNIEKAYYEMERSYPGSQKNISEKGNSSQKDSAHRRDARGRPMTRVDKSILDKQIDRYPPRMDSGKTQIA